MDVTIAQPSPMQPFAALLATDKFVRIDAAAMRPIVEAFGTLSDWEAFAAGWDRLQPDTYMADGGRYRRRRHAVFSADDHGPIRREAHQAHYQGLDYNTLNGGVERWFEPVEPTLAGGPSCLALLRSCRAAFSTLAPSKSPWKIEMHQFRIEAKVGTAGKPTPEGMHRDGVDFVMVMMIKRTNIQSGETITTDANGNQLGQFTLTQPFDTVLLDDHCVFHGVTPVEPVDPALPAHRDVLVVTFRRTDLAKLHV